MTSRALNWADLVDSDDEYDAPTTKTIKTTKNKNNNNATSTPLQQPATINNTNTTTTTGAKDISPFTDANTSTNQLTDEEEDDACRALVYDESTPSKQYREVTIGAAVPYTFKSVWNTAATSTNSNSNIVNSTGNTPSAGSAESYMQQQQQQLSTNTNNINNNTVDVFRAAQVGAASSSFSPAHTTSFVSALLSNLPTKLSPVQQNNNNTNTSNIIATTAAPTSPLAATAPVRAAIPSMTKGDAPVVVELRQLLSSTDSNSNNNSNNHTSSATRKSMPLAEVAKQLQWEHHYASSLGPLVEFLRRHRGEFVLKGGCVSLVDINDRLLNELMRVQWGQK